MKKENKLLRTQKKIFCDQENIVKIFTMVFFSRQSSYVKAWNFFFRFFFKKKLTLSKKL